MSEQPDLVERLQAAAAEAIANQTSAISADGGHVKSLTLELELSHSGAVIDSTCWIERRGVHRRRERAS